MKKKYCVKAVAAAAAAALLYFAISSIEFKSLEIDAHIWHKKQNHLAIERRWKEERKND